MQVKQNSQNVHIFVNTSDCESRQTTLPFLFVKSKPSFSPSTKFVKPLLFAVCCLHCDVFYIQKTLPESSKNQSSNICSFSVSNISTSKFCDKGTLVRRQQYKQLKQQVEISFSKRRGRWKKREVSAGHQDKEQPHELQHHMSSIYTNTQRRKIMEML